MAKKLQLKNGLKVLLVESKKSPVVSVQMWVRTGSADERKHEAGISHFIEHLVFKGTKKFGVGEIAATVEGSGGELNAYTSFDQTVFYVTISKEFADQGLEVVSEMMGHPLFDSAEIDNEREVVIEEIKRGKDSPSRRASQLLFSTCYPKHAYGRPVIGYEEIIKKVSVKTIKKYFADRYSPKNMFLIVSGDFENKDMQLKIHKYFDDFKSTAVRKVKRTKEGLQKKSKIAIENSDFKESQAYLSWRIPNVRHKDIPALDMLAFILGQGDSSRIVKDLRIENSFVNSAGASAYTPQDDGIFSIFLSLDPKNFSKALNGLSESLGQFLKEGPSAEEMQKAINCFTSEQIYSVETVDGIARKIGSLEFYMKDPDYFPKYLKEINRLKAVDILKIAKKYLDPNKINISILTDQDQASVNKLAQGFINDYKEKYSLKQELMAKSKQKIVPLKFQASKGQGSAETEKIVLANGMKILFQKQNNTPTFSLKMAFRGGVRVEPEGMLGTTEILARAWAAGSKSFNEAEINHKVDTLAAGLGSFGGRNTIGLNLDGLSNFEKDLGELFFDVLENPTWSEEVIEREKTILKHQIKTRDDNPSQVCSNQFMKAMFDGHVYSRDVLGTEASVDKINQSKIKEAFNNTLTDKGTTLCLVGDFDKKYWLDRIQKYSEKIGNKKNQDSIKPPSAIQSEIKKSTKLEREQTHIIVGYRGLTLDSPERYTLHVIQSILAGQGGRLFYELRDKNSLAYSVSPIRMEGIDAGYFGGYIGCSPEKTEKSIAMLKEEFAKLCETKVSDVELARAQRYLVGRHDIDLQRNSSVCAAYLFDEIYGIDYSEVFKANKRYFSVTKEDVQNLSQKIFRQNAVISIVGL